MLETLGAWLDEESPRCFTLLEVVDGFTVILTPNTPGRPQISEIHFDSEALSRRRRRSALSTFATGAPRRWTLAIAGREEFLRALGYELDFHDAHSVIIDELDNQLLLTYSYFDAVQGVAWRKHIVCLGPRDVSTIIEVAGQRKREQKKANRILRW
jgi:hypothetical protein